MDDVLNCPICCDKLRNSHLENKWLYPIGKTANYIERLCCKSHSHIVSIYTDEKTNQVDFLRLSLNPTYDTIVEIDFVNQKSLITLIKGCDSQHIKIDKLLEVDFPNLVSLREKCNLFTLFS